MDRNRRMKGWYSKRKRITSQTCFGSDRSVGWSEISSGLSVLIDCVGDAGESSQMCRRGSSSSDELLWLSNRFDGSGRSAAGTCC